MKRLLIVLFALFMFVPNGYADEYYQYTVFTMDTPIKWSPRVVGQAVEGLYEGIAPRLGWMEKEGIENIHVIGMPVESSDYVDAQMDRLPATLVYFLREYTKEAEKSGGMLSLRQIADICLSRQVDLHPLFCERLLQNVLAFQAKVDGIKYPDELLDPSDGNLNDVYNEKERLYSKDLLFYTTFFGYDYSNDSKFFRELDAEVMYSPVYGEFGKRVCKLFAFDGKGACEATLVKGDVCQDYVFTVKFGGRRNISADGKTVYFGGYSDFMKSLELDYKVSSAAYDCDTRPMKKDRLYL